MLLLSSLATMMFLIFLEGVLSLDNALVLAVMVKHLPVPLRRKALTYGLAGAFAFRLLSLLLLTHFMHFTWVKLFGGCYLVFLFVNHIVGLKEVEAPGIGTAFWPTVIAIELTDICFALDSIFAGVGVTQELWIVFFGGVFGIVAMRFVASGFTTLLDKFPSLEGMAYQLVLVIGMKLILEVALPDFLPAWGFWGLMALLVLNGFMTRSGCESSRA